MNPAKPAKEEPEVVQEEDIPLDGVDQVGQEMMKDVRNDKLEVAPGEEGAAEADREGEA